MQLSKLSLWAGAASIAFASAAWAEDQPAAPAAAAPAAPAAPAPPPFPLGMDGPIAINPTPLTVKSGLPFLGSVTINGAVTGFGLWQDNPVGSDKHDQFDLTNGQVLISKSDGLVQFLVDVGTYSFPALGTPYLPTAKAVNANFGAIPEAYLKLQFTPDFSIQAGKLATLIGAEFNYTFENMNIERGLLWNQENLINRGVQANYTKGPLALSVSVNDGYYSNNLSWITGSATWTFNPANILVFSAGGNFRNVNTFNSATPLLQNNGEMYNLIYTHTDGPWTFVPYIQYTEAHALPAFGTGTASTFGGALFVDYTVPADAKLGGVPLGGLSLPFRFEYISSTGKSVSLLYGPGSNAYSLTFTPTFQYQIYFIRAEFSYVEASSTTPGFAFGANGNGKSQTRGLIEIGTVF
jgi:hypothetical protein